MSGCSDCSMLAAPKALESLVECFWISRPAHDYDCQVAPDGCVDLCLVHSERGPEAIVLGPATQASKFRMKAGFSYSCVRFRPGIGARILGQMASALANSSVRLDLPLNCNLHEPPKGQDSVEIRAHLESFLNSLLVRFKDHPPRYLEEAIRLIDDLHGEIRVHEIAQRLRISRRQLERAFLERVGMTPKLYARIARFRAALEYLKLNPGKNRAEAAAQYGFSDQSHLAREARRFGI